MYYFLFTGVAEGYFVILLLSMVAKVDSLHQSDFATRWWDVSTCLCRCVKRYACVHPPPPYFCVPGRQTDCGKLPAEASCCLLRRCVAMCFGCCPFVSVSVFVLFTASNLFLIPCLSLTLTLSRSPSVFCGGGFGRGRSWRVRWSAANKFHELCAALGGQLTNGPLSEAYVNLLSDSEAEVIAPHLFVA